MSLFSQNIFSINSQRLMNFIKKVIRKARSMVDLHTIFLKDCLVNLRIIPLKDLVDINQKKNFNLSLYQQLVTRMNLEMTILKWVIIWGMSSRKLCKHGNKVSSKEKYLLNCWMTIVIIDCYTNLIKSITGL